MLYDKITPSIHEVGVIGHKLLMSKYRSGNVRTNHPRSNNNTKHITIQK